MEGGEKILIIGRTETGKSCLKGQLLRKLTESDSIISLDKASENISEIIKITESQSRGLRPERTSKEKDIATVFHLKLENENVIDMIWPDYAGEKIVDIVRERQIPIDWEVNIKESTIWFLFIRLDKLKPLDSLLNMPREYPNVIEGAPKLEISDYSFFIELLQILLYVKGVGTRSKVSEPVLQVCLSFWDELDQKQVANPKQELMNRCPLLVEYIDSQWKNEKIAYLGISPQEMKLKNNEADVEKDPKVQEFIDAPEDFGYVIKENGEKVKDLTYLIQNSLNLL